MTTQKISIILPVYNEGGNIATCLCKLRDAMRNHDHEILICYDFDEDTTLSAIEAMPDKPATIRLVRNRLGRGPAYAIRAGFEAAEGDAIVTSMADLSDPPELIPQMADLIRNHGADVVSGSRYMRGGSQSGGPLLKRTLSRVAGLTLRYAGGLGTHDATTNFRAFSRRLVDRIKPESNKSFSLGLEMTVKAHLAGFKVMEIPSSWTDRAEGKSNFKLFTWMPQYLGWFFKALAVPACIWLLYLLAYFFLFRYLVIIPEVHPIRHGLGVAGIGSFALLALLFIRHIRGKMDWVDTLIPLVVMNPVLWLRDPRPGIAVSLALVLALVIRTALRKKKTTGSSMAAILCPPRNPYARQRPGRTLGYYWKRLPVFLAALCLLFVLHFGINLISGVSVPFGEDQFRDVSIAQAILDGKYPLDPVYSDAVLWYTPLTAYIVAATAKIMNITPMIADVLIGPYLNLLIPVTLFILVALLLDSWSALATMVLFLFVGPLVTAVEGRASYSPWLFAPIFAQATFFLTMTFFLLSLRRDRAIWHVLTGICLGVTFMGHAYPAVLGGSIIFAVTLRRIFAERKGGLASPPIRRAVRNFFIIVAIAFVSSLPFSYAILVRYHFKIVNHISYVYSEYTLAAIPEFLAKARTWSVAVAAGGLLALAFHRRLREEKWILILWLTVSAAFFLSTYALQYLALHNIQVSEFVPSYHYFLYLCIMKSILAGYGIVFGCQLLMRAGGRFFKDPAFQRVGGQFLALCVICTIFAQQVKSYDHRLEFEIVRPKESYNQNREDHYQTYLWLIGNTSPDDTIFLFSGGHEDLSVISPAARNLVVTSIRSFSNPYIDYFPRLAYQNALMDALMTHNVENFISLGKKKHVNYILTSDHRYSELLRIIGKKQLSRVFISDGFRYSIFKVS